MASPAIEYAVKLAEIIGATGIVTGMASVFTAMMSRGKDKGDPNGERKRLQDENDWLRRQLEEYRRQHD